MYKSQSSSLYNIQNCPLTSSFFGPYIFSVLGFSNSCVFYIFPSKEGIIYYTHTKQPAKVLSILESRTDDNSFQLNNKERFQNLIFF